MHRRIFIRRLLSTSIAAISGLLHAKQAAATWPADHFGNGEFSLQFQQLFANQTIIDSDELLLSIPDSAENGAVVPITISSDLDDIRKIYIWVEKNPTPLAAEFELNRSAICYLTARIKMAESCHVIVLAQQGQRLLRAQSWVNVMVGGCGAG
ncbi:MAG: thiosulfate oxidation carrier protein SoxY [Methylomonas sp.]|nr:thiosulfate oxidation carrier protein SoxY [Methylomonas sp.]